MHICIHTHARTYACTHAHTQHIRTHASTLSVNSVIILCITVSITDKVSTSLLCYGTVICSCVSVTCSVLVLSDGQMVEYDTPRGLLSKKGQFYALAKESGLTS